MRLDDLAGRMRAFEAALDPAMLPDVFLVARLDGRGFTRLTKEAHPFERPFDRRFHDMMCRTAEHLMADCGLSIAYAHTQSDEISLLFPPGSQAFGRRPRKLLSILAGAASARFSLLLGAVAVFDCRMAQLPSADHVVDYFRWRAEDAHRNALGSHCYWLLRGQGLDANRATEALRGLAAPAKHDLLFRAGIRFNDLPGWQQRGSGLSWEEFERAGEDPATGERVVARRRRISCRLDLPARDAYAAFIRNLTDHLEASRGQVA